MTITATRVLLGLCNSKLRSLFVKNAHMYLNLCIEMFLRRFSPRHRSLLQTKTQTKKEQVTLMSRLGKCTNFNAEHYWKDVYGQVHSCKCNFNQLDDDISDKAD